MKNNLKTKNTPKRHVCPQILLLVELYETMNKIMKDKKARETRLLLHNKIMYLLLEWYVYLFNLACMHALDKIVFKSNLDTKLRS